MESNREVFLRMSEEHYMSIPDEIRECFLRSKRIEEEVNDWNDNMKDDTFAKLSNTIKETKKKLSERQYQLREERRKINK